MVTEVLQQTWANVLEELKNHTGQARFNLWFRNTELLDCNDDCVKVGVPTVFIQDWLRQHFTSVVEECLCRVMGRRLKARFVIEPRLFHQLRQEELREKVELVEGVAAASDKLSSALGAEPKYHLNEHLDLERFVAGPCNELAYAAARQVAGGAVTTFSPLFLHGGSGVGKTHLLQGICLAVNRHQRPLRALYLTGEAFTNQYIASLRYQSNDAFRAHVRGVDLLAIDDVHFLANKTRIQEEFLHTLDALATANNQVVLASNVHPRGIINLNHSLASRFVAGMVVELRPPDHQTRRAILMRKLEERKLHCPDEVLNFLSYRLDGSVRELLGVTNALVALGKLYGKDPDMAMAYQALGALKGRSRSALSIDQIVSEVAKEFGLKPEQLYSSRRTQRVSLPRQVAIYLARELLGWSYGEIARHFGRRDHSTAVFACKKIARLLKDDAKVQHSLAHLLNELRR